MKSCLHRVWMTILILSLTVTLVNGQGAIVHGVGPVNRGMGGAGTAAPMDAIGALHWNPGSISGLQCNEVSFGLELLLADIELTTTVAAVTTSTSGEAGVSSIPAVGWTHHVEDTPWTVGLGVYGVAGFRNNMPADAANPILAAGPLFADAEFMQIAPTFSYAVTDRLSIGIAPTITTAKVTLDPLGPSVVTPLAVDGSGNRLHWGGGAQVGIYYLANQCWSFGATVKSPQWFEEFRFFTPAGVIRFDMDYPMLVSVGASYHGIQDWVFAVDARYHDFKNTDGFRELGWSNVFAGAVGAQRRLNDCLTVRFGYNFNQNPIQDGDVFTNVATPLIQDQNVSAGASALLADNVQLNLAYIYLFENSVSGPLPAGLFGPNASMSNEINAHSLAAGIRVQY